MDSTDHEGFVRLIHLTEFNHFDPDKASGSPYWMSKSLASEGVNVHNFNVTIPDKLMPPLAELQFRLRHYFLKIFKREHLVPDYFTLRSLYIAETINPRLESLNADVILTSASPLSAAFLESSKPIVYWTDATYANLISSNPRWRFHHPDTMWDGHVITSACLKNASLLLFSSHWAARSAIETYGISKQKIKIVPYGANLQIDHDYADIKRMIAARPKNLIKLLFVGKRWYLKNGVLVLDVAKALHATGHRVELTIVGCIPDESPLPSYVTCIKNLSKKIPADVHRLKQLYESSHFLFVPSLTEAFGIVFCEANAFGTPCLTTHVGGISDVVKDGINGMTFSLEATTDDYCRYITHLMSHPLEYEALALSSFNEYITRLNWQTSAREVKKLIQEIL